MTKKFKVSNFNNKDPVYKDIKSRLIEMANDSFIEEIDKHIADKDYKPINFNNDPIISLWLEASDKHSTIQCIICTKQFEPEYLSDPECPVCSYECWRQWNE